MVSILTEVSGFFSSASNIESDFFTGGAGGGVGSLIEKEVEKNELTFGAGLEAIGGKPPSEDPLIGGNPSV